MKKLLLLLLPFVVASAVSISAQAQNWAHAKYTLFGEYKDVGFNQNKQTVIINPTDVESEQLILLEGKNAIESFAKSLVAMKEEYIALKNNNSSTTKMSTSFGEFSLFWKYLKKTSGNVCSDIHPTYVVSNSNGEILRCAMIRNIIEDVENSKNTAKLLLIFRSESEIQSLIDILNTCIELLGGVPSSQNSSSSSENSLLGTDWRPKTDGRDKEDVHFFDYTSFDLGISYAGVRKITKTYYVKGIMSRTAIEKYHIMCVDARGDNSAESYYFYIPNEKICNVWLSALTGMKELFLKNDKIAKDNNVIADVVKNVSDKFNFDGWYGELTSSQWYSGWPVVKKYSEEIYNKYGYNDAQQAVISVVYYYQNGKSTMVLSTYGGNWTFNKAEDFDEVIKIFNWSNFMKAIDEQAQEIKRQQALEAKKKQQQALFD